MAKNKETFPKREERVRFGENQPRTRTTTTKTRSESRSETRSEKQKNSRPTNTPPRKSKKTGAIPKKYILFGIIGILIVSVAYMLFRKNGTEVFVAEESFGVLTGTNYTAEQLIETIETQLAGIVGTEVRLNEEITTKAIHISNSRKKDVSQLDYLIPKIRNAVTYKVNGAVLYIDGGKALVVTSQETADSVLKQIQDSYLPETENASSASWEETINIEMEFVDSDEILSAEEALKILQSTTTVTTTYTVKSGDSAYRIASEYDTTIEEIFSLNDGMSISTPIVVGQIINVPIQKPRISVKTVETQVLTTVEPKTYEYQYDSTQPSSYQRVVQQGRAGQSTTTIQITRINGFVTEEKEVSKEVLVEPITEIIVRGTA